MMKVFKTILWTSFFWMLLLGGVWAASFWVEEVASGINTLLPEPVWMDIYNQGLKKGFENAKLECSCPECGSTTWEVNTQTGNTMIPSTIPATCKTFYDGCNTCNRLENGEAACTLMYCETYWEPKCLDTEASTTSGNQILAVAENTNSQSSSNELATLQNKVAELEKNHWALVQELQAIFSTPEGMKLLPAPVANQVNQN